MEISSHLFTVSELNSVIKDVLEQSFYNIQVEGEISNFRPAASGHYYFSIRDRDSSISAVMFRGNQQHLSFRLKDGLHVKVRGKLSLYSQRGTYQIICNTISLFGEGDILLMLEERKRRLASLGVFDPSKKREIPKIPQRIGIITSPTGAAIQDILKVLHRRHCLSEITIYPTLVQGQEAAGQICRELERVNRDQLCDLIILSRGGGSIEDLLPFSDESVVMAIYNSKLPVVTGIGHEIDTSLSDLTADIRAATPSAAAEIVTNESEKIYHNILRYKKEFIYNIELKLQQIRTKLRTFSPETAERVLSAKIENYKLLLDHKQHSLIQDITSRLSEKHYRVKQSKLTLEQLSPQKLFSKGYAWVTKDSVNIMNSDLNCGDTIEINYLNGKIRGEVSDI